MNVTNNYGLRKPEVTDIVDIDDLNYNADIVDTELASREGLLKDAEEKTTLTDTDTIPLSDSATSSRTKKISFINLKKVLKTYFDTLYNKYTHPSYTSKASGLYKVTVDSTGHVSGTEAVTKEDITALGATSSEVAVTLAAASWAGSAAPYTYNVTISGHDNQTDKVDLMMGDTMTAEQLKVAQTANITKAEWTSNTVLKFYAYGTKPTVALPVKINVRKL